MRLATLVTSKHNYSAEEGDCRHPQCVCVYVSDFAPGHTNRPTVIKIDTHVPLDDI